MDVEFKKLLIRVSLKAAEESQGSIRDLFLQQAARLESEIDAFVLKEFDEYAAKNPPKKTVITKVCRHPGSSLRFYSSDEATAKKYAVCTICWTDFPKSRINRSKWYGRSSVKKAPRGKHPRN